MSFPLDDDDDEDEDDDDDDGDGDGDDFLSRSWSRQAGLKPPS